MNNSLDKLISHLENYISLSPNEVEYLNNNISITNHKKNEIFFHEGNVSRTIYYVLDGVVRLFYDVKGIEKTAFFYTEGDFICAGESFTFNIPAKENYQVVQSAQVIHFDKSLVEKLLLKIPKLEIIARVATENELITCQKLIASFVTQSAEERYVDLLQSHSSLFQRVPQNYIASYLGVSPETLSRIKKRVMLKS